MKRTAWEINALNFRCLSALRRVLFGDGFAIVCLDIRSSIFDCCLLFSGLRLLERPGQRNVDRVRNASAKQVVTLEVCGKVLRRCH